MIRGVVKTINVTSEDIELIDFMLTNNERVANKIPNSDLETKTRMQQLHTSLRKTLKEAK